MNYVKVKFNLLIFIQVNMSYDMYKKAVLILLMGVTACNLQSQDQKSNPNKLKWSVRMANSVLSRSDSLIYYVDRNPKWAYDVAFLGMAVDRLGNIDPRYSEYMENMG